MKCVESESSTAPAPKPAARPARPRAKKPPGPIRHNEQVPKPCQAAQIAVVMMKRLRVSTWQYLIRELADRPDAAALVALTPRQQELLREYDHLLPYLTATSGSGVTVVACPVCGEYALHGTKGQSSGCYLTLACPGKLVRASMSEQRARPETETAPPMAAPEPEPSRAAGVERPEITQPAWAGDDLFEPDDEEPIASEDERRGEAQPQDDTVRDVPAETPEQESPPAPTASRAPSFVAIDFELATASKASPVEIGMVRVVDGEVVETFQSYICPPERVEVFAAWQRNNFSFGPEVQDDAPTWPEILDVIRDFSAHEGRQLPIIAHNTAGTERHVLAKTSVECGLPAPQFPLACTLEVAKRLDPEAGRYGLDVLAARYGVDLGVHHQALDDAHATAHVALHLFGMDGGREAFVENVKRFRNIS